MDGGKFKRRLTEVNTRAVSKGQNELVCKFKMAGGDMVSIKGQVMEYTYIPTGIFIIYSTYLLISLDDLPVEVGDLFYSFSI